jgi:ABC-type nitrate/sulfonate/bicarbonate transport system substrate-binding protein
MKIRKIIGSGLIVAIFLLSQLTGVWADENKLKTLEVHYDRFIDDLPLYVALEKGFWQEEGVDVKLVHLKGETNIIAALLHGDVKFATLGVASIVHAAQKNIPARVVVWNGHTHKGTRCGMHSDKSLNMKNISELKGKRIAASGSIQTLIFIEKTLELSGYTKEDVQIIKGIKLDDAMKHEAALRSQGVDVIVA